MGRPNLLARMSFLTEGTFSARSTSRAYVSYVTVMPRFG